MFGCSCTQGLVLGYIEKVQAAGDRARAISPTVRPRERETGYFQAPVRVERGFNTLIWAKVGGIDVQVLIDTGAARSLIKTGLANDLRAMKAAKGHISPALKVSPPITIEGVGGDSRTSVIS